MSADQKNKRITPEQLGFWGVCGTFFLIPLGTSPFLFAGLITVCLWICSGNFIKGWNLWLNKKWVLPSLAFIALHWIGLLYTNDIRTGLEFASKTYYWLFAFAISSMRFQENSPKTLINSFLVGLALAAIVQISMFTGIIPAINDQQTTFINPITYMLLLIFGILLLSFYFSKAQKAKDKLLYGMGALLFFASLALFVGAPGRTALLSLILTSPLIVYNFTGRRSFLKTLSLTLLFAIGLFFSPVVQSSLNDTVAQIQTYYKGDPVSSIGLRLHMWDGAIKIFMENPVIGSGTGGYQLAMARHANPMLDPESFKFSQPHNSFLYMAVSFGIIGVAVLLWMFTAFLRAGWRHRDTLPGFAILSYGIIMIIASLTDSQIIEVHSAILFALLTGLQTSLRGVIKEERAV